jgi:hypothetical protein
MPIPLKAHTPAEVDYYLMVTACGECNHGPWRIESSERDTRDARLLRVQACCAGCGAGRAFSFHCDGDSQQLGEHVEQVNLTDEPSRIIDLSQWLSLFCMLIESAAAKSDKVAARSKGFQAALCLTEALKFYGDDELPDESAFFTDETRAVFREHPEKFARQRLRDMQAKLPSLPKMAIHVRRDVKAKAKRWWRFRK